MSTIFTGLETPNSQNPGGTETPRRKHLTPSQIREKVRLHREKEAAAKVEISPSAKKKKAAAAPQAETRPSPEGENKALSQVEVIKIDPEATKKKLRDVLASGSFPFNGPERHVLEKILGQEKES